MEEKFIEDIANKISDGIIILNSNDKVIYANNYVRKALNIQSIDLEKVEISIGKDPEVNKIGIKAKGIDYDGIGELLEVDFDSYNYKNIIIFL